MWLWPEITTSNPEASGLQIELRQIMEHVDGGPADLDDFGLRELPGPSLFVDVAADRRHGRDRQKLFQNLGSTHVARMDDMLRLS